MSYRRRGAGSRARPRSCACPCRGTEPCLPSTLQLERLRRLRLVGMIGAGVDLELQELRRGELVLLPHPLPRLAEHVGRAPVELLAQRAAREPARIARMAVVHLLVELLAGDRDLLRVDDDDEVAP